MSKSTKTWLVTASLLVLAGCIIFVGAMMKLNWDFTKLTTSKYKTNTYEIEEEYKNISVVTDTADIVFITAEETKTKVVCYEQENVEHTVTVKDGELLIEISDLRKWYEHIEINFANPKITVYLPQGEYGALAVNTSTGNVEVPEGFEFESIDISASTGNIQLKNISAANVDLSALTGRITASDISCTDSFNFDVSTGKSYLSDITCKNITSTGNTGSAELERVIAGEKISLKRSTGNIKLDKCDAAEIFIKTDTGDVKGSLISDKVFITATDTGKVEVPKSTKGGNCEIITSTGNIIISVND